MTNIREVLSRYVHLQPEVEVEVIKAIKEYSESLVDLCADSAETQLEPYYRGSGEVPYIVNRESIEKVKELIK